MQPQIPLTRDLVLIGGGHAHALAARMWGMKPVPGVRLTLINPGPTAPYSGMLPGHIAGHYGRDELEIDLMHLCRHAGARLILGAATGIDRAAREITVEGHGAVAYDVASIDVGITAKMDLPGFAQHAVGAKPLDVYAARWREFLAAVKAGVQPCRMPDESGTGHHTRRPAGQEPRLLRRDRHTRRRGRQREDPDSGRR